MMSTVCKLNECTGCMLCVDICPHNAIKIQDSLDTYNAVIDKNKCTNCRICLDMCQKNNSPEFIRPIEWYQGWIKLDSMRKDSSSGGAAKAIAQSFIAGNGVVYSCTFKNGNFLFESIDTCNELNKFSGSKYVKSNPINVYKSIKNDLMDGRSVLFIGLPCQAAALKKYIPSKFNSNLSIVDLICHGTPSPRLLEIFLNQYNLSLNNIDNISFRYKGKFHISCNGKEIITKGVTDKYSIAFLNSLIYTESCYRCDYARFERVSDITLGDSWGSSLSYNEKEKGISLILLQTKKGMELVKNSQLHLEPVDIENAINNNGQLRSPSAMPVKRKRFFINVSNGKTFNKSVFIGLPKQCLRQNIKELLIKSGILKLTEK